MNQSQILFLDALKHALNHEKLNNISVSSELWMDVFHIAQQQHVLPLIYDAVHQCEHGDYITHVKRNVLQQVMLQTQKTQEFLRLYQKMREQNLTPLVVKGLICRNCYPASDLRPSSDEDVLIPSDQFHACHELLIASGCMTDCIDLHSVDEVSYHSKGVLYLELHKSLFNKESAYSHMNDFFTKAIENRKEFVIEGVSVLTMNETDHLFYLIVHALKHFMHSGFGIRQVCDVVMFVNRYASVIDWERFDKQCELVHAHLFVSAIFKIGIMYLTLDKEKLPDKYSSCDVDESFMLEDLLDSGVYGKSTLSRVHSSTITLDAVSNYQHGKKSKLLLPVAWMHRLIHYGKQTLTTKNNNALESIQIGKQRVELLKKYDIIK